MHADLTGGNVGSARPSDSSPESYDLDVRDAVRGNTVLGRPARKAEDFLRETLATAMRVAATA